MLDGANWFAKLTASKPTRAIVSPLSRCLETAQLALNGLSLTHMEVEELIRETLGEDTCDARR
jgi:broad specificity phosphatase PhoE